MALLKSLICRIFGYCVEAYSEECDPVAQRIIAVGQRVEQLEHRYWRPSDLYDIR